MPRRLLVGGPVRGSRTGQPIMALLDLLGRRWALRVLWELRDAPAGFRELQARCGGMSPSVLNQRLAELVGHRLLEVDDDGAYRLSAHGRSLAEVLLQLSRWTEGWAGALKKAR
jgi:DNA-binding HxlR family transcriptional regulator